MPTMARVESLAEAAAGWVFLHRLFRFPSLAQWEWLHEDRVSLAWHLLASEVDATLAGELPLPESLDWYREEFIAAFEVGMPEPPCPLIESHWNKREPVPRVLHENILYHKQFGLSLKTSANESADHLRHQLEFIHYLCHVEAGQAAAGRVPDEGYAASRRDFLARHLLSWVPAAAVSLAERQPDQWPAAWMTMLAGWCVIQAGKKNVA